MFILPQSSKPGTTINSITFIVTTTTICVIALSFDLNLVKIQMAIAVSASPIKSVISRECSLPKIPATICWCRGTRLSTLQNSPLANHTVAIKTVNVLCLFSFISVCAADRLGLLITVNALTLAGNSMCLPPPNPDNHRDGTEIRIKNTELATEAQQNIHGRSRHRITGKKTSLL